LQCGAVRCSAWQCVPSGRLARISERLSRGMGERERKREKKREKEKVRERERERERLQSSFYDVSTRHAPSHIL